MLLFHSFYEDDRNFTKNRESARKQPKKKAKRRPRHAADKKRKPPLDGIQHRRKRPNDKKDAEGGGDKDEKAGDPIRLPKKKNAKGAV